MTALSRWEDDGGQTRRSASSGGPPGHDGDALRLEDGRRVWLRPVVVSDEAAIREFLDRFCLDTRRTRFFSVAADMRLAAHWAASGDAKDHLGLLALDADQRVLGHAAYARVEGTEAEVAVEVADEMHHLGLGTMLLLGLGRLAEANEIDHFVADVLPDNHEMLAVFHDGFDSIQHRDEGVVKVSFPTSSWKLAESRFGQPPSL